MPVVARHELFSAILASHGLFSVKARLHLLVVVAVPLAAFLRSMPFACLRSRVLRKVLPHPLQLLVRYSCCMNPVVLRSCQERKIAYVVVRFVEVDMMHLVALWYRTVVETPDIPMQPLHHRAVPIIAALIVSRELQPVEPLVFFRHSTFQSLDCITSAIIAFNKSTDSFRYTFHTRSGTHR